MRLSKKHLTGFDPLAEIASIVNNPTENPNYDDISDNGCGKGRPSLLTTASMGPLRIFFGSEIPIEEKPSATNC